MAKFNSILLVPGVIGQEPGDLYANIGEFVKSTHEFKSETIENLEKKLKFEEKRTDALVKDVKEDLMDFMKIQEQEIANLRAKVNQIDEEVEHLINDEHDDDDRSHHEDDEHSDHQDDIEREDADSVHDSQESRHSRLMRHSR